MSYSRRRGGYALMPPVYPTYYPQSTYFVPSANYTPYPYGQQLGFYRSPYRQPYRQPYRAPPNQPSLKRKAREEEEEEIKTSSQRTLISAPPKAYNIYSRVSRAEPTFEPEIYIPGLQDIISGYSAGTCGVITDSGQHCWTTNREISPEHELYNCRSYCFQQSNEWLLPIILNHPTEILFELTNTDWTVPESVESKQINLEEQGKTQRYKLEIKGLGYPDLDGITVEYSAHFKDNQWLYYNVGIYFQAIDYGYSGSDWVQEAKLRQDKFNQRAPEWIAQFVTLFPGAYYDHHANSGWIRFHPNERQVYEIDLAGNPYETIKGGFDKIGREQFASELSAFFNTILQPIFSNSLGPTKIRFEIQFESSSIPDVLDYKSLRVTVPDFFDSQAEWKMEIPKEGYIRNGKIETDASFISDVKYTQPEQQTN